MPEEKEKGEREGKKGEKCAEERKKSTKYLDGQLKSCPEVSLLRFFTVIWQGQVNVV